MTPLRRPRDLGLQTDLLTGSRGLQTRRHGEFLVVRTPEFDGFFFGNKLRLPAPPKPAELPTVLEAWAEAFGDASGVSKIVLQWEAPYDETAPADDGVLAEAAQEFGLEPDHDVVLRLGAFSPVPPRSPMSARTISSDRDWAMTLHVGREEDSTPPRETFHAWRRQEHRYLVEQGRGLWWLAEADGEPVSSAGIFWNEQGTLARFQDVDTSAGARNRGFASGLLSAMLDDLLKRLPNLETCVIVTTSGSQAERIYRRLGFEPVTRMDALWGDRH